MSNNYLIIWEYNQFYFTNKLEKELLQAFEDGICDIIRINKENPSYLATNDCWLEVPSYDELKQDIYELR